MWLVFWYNNVSDDECKALCNGEQITLDLVSRNNKPYKLTGQLSNLEYQGRKYVGFAKVMPEKSNSKKTVPGWMKDVADKANIESQDSINFGL